MPELPEVTTTVHGLQTVLPGKIISDVWTDIATEHPTRKNYYQTIKSISFLNYFKKQIIGKKITHISRKGKHIFIHLEHVHEAIHIHMKMTGHLLYGAYKKENDSWVPPKGPLEDPYNQFIHVVWNFASSPFSLALCDVRKFATVGFCDPESITLGPDALTASITEAISKKPNQYIKTALLDQSLISGIGNIYSDEALWASGIHPISIVSKIPKERISLLQKKIRVVLKQGIDFNGDSTSDYRTIEGTPGSFHLKHAVYRKEGTSCIQCGSLIMRTTIKGRGTYYCSGHQIIY